MERKFNKKLIIGIISVAVVATTGIIASVIIFQPQDNIDSRIRSLMSQGNIPSLAAGIVVNDTLVWSKGYGDQPDGVDSVYMIGSITKIFTATAIMQLYDNNTLDLDTDIDTYIPFSVRNPNYPSIPITIRDLLTHSSGISKIDKPLWDHDADFINWTNNNLGTNYTAWDPRPTLGDFLNGSLNPYGQYYELDTWESFAPGTGWQYSNLAFLLLAYIVEEITNQSYAEYLQENVLSPLGMTNTGFNYTDFIGRNAIPYEQNDTQLIEGPIYNFYNIGGGGLRSTVHDLTKFLIAHMNQGSYNNTQILLPQTVVDMQTAEFSLSGSDLGGFTFIGQGLGWPLYSGNIIGHGGAVPGYLAQISFKTVSNGKYGIVFMLNKGSSFVQDNYLLNTFFPSLIEILFDEAARLFSL
ncbi:MAG: beta-lactamase family protein [Promethearchaeota archaeon]|nr:MAG: beta-lactamase family protein [Candidatus Lokiarchaeota archaeon]